MDPAALEAAWNAAPPLPKDRGEVRLLVQRLGDGRHASPAEARFTRDGGMDGDRWRLDEDPERGSQVTLMCARSLELVSGGRGLVNDSGDNIIVDLDLSESELPAGTVLRVGQVELEVTAEPHTGCRKFSARFGSPALRWLNDKAHRPRRLRGIHARVLTDGVIRVGDAVTRIPCSSPPA